MQVGRQAERQRIDALLAGARIGQSGVLVLTGEPGIGKTWLLDHAAGRAEGMHTLTITGSEAERDLPYAGLAQLRIGPGDLDRLPQPQAQALGVALALRTGAGADRFAVGAGVVTWSTQRSEEKPLCLLIDDAHLVDRPSQEALAFLARRLLADAVAMLVTARSAEPCVLVAPDLPQLRLSGLDRAATRQLLDAAGHGRASTELVTRILESTGGNPLAIRELAREPDQLLTLPPGSPTPVPTALAELYARRATELDEQALTAVQLAAAAGEDLALISRACAALGVPTAALAAAEEAGLIVIEPDRLRFTHPLARSGLYAIAGSARRRDLQRVIADAVGDGDPDRRAWHRSASVIGADAAVAGEMDSVARRATDRGAFSVAAAAAERAAALSMTEAEAAARLVAAGESAWHAGDAVRAIELCDRAARQEPATSISARTRRLRGVIAARCGALDQARDILLQAAAEAASPAEAIACYAEAINVCLYLADARSALTASEATVALLDTADPRGRVTGELAAGMGRVLAGMDGSALLRAGVAGRSAWQGSPASVDETILLVQALLFLRDSSHGRDQVQQAVDQCRDRAAIGSLPHLLFHLARDEAATDRWANAEANYTEAIAIAREFGQTTERTASLAGLAWLEARQGRESETTSHAAEAIGLAGKFRIHLARIWAEFALADLALACGDIGLAGRRYAALDQLLDDLGVLDVDLSPVPELVETLLRTGQAARAESLVGAYVERARAKGQPWAQARAARTQGWLASEVELDDQFRAALKLHAATLDDFETARTRLAYGSRLRRARRRVDARPELREALAIFSRLGARPWADEAARELSATGATVVRPGESAVSQMTPRELQIAVLLAEGRTTRQVATALFLSPKTVEYHLRHVYTKLAIESRTELARLMAEATREA